MKSFSFESKRYFVIENHIFLVPYENSNWLVYWGKERNSSLVFILKKTEFGFSFENFYAMTKENSSRYLRRLVCYPSFIEFLDFLQLDPRSIRAG